MNTPKLSALIFTVAASASVAFAACADTAASEDPALKDMFAGKFLMGAAINTSQASGRDSVGAAAIKHHFNSVVAENCMKCERIHPERDRYDWTSADSFVEFAQQNGMHIVGHCLIWHSQCAPWFLVDDEGKYVSADTLKERMRNHIYAVVGRYKGRVNGWDVVNEAIVEDGSYRKSGFYEILGEEFIPLAFQYAQEADPDAELYINDYGMNVPGRRDAYVKIVRDLKGRGLRIDAIGMQSHMGIDYPDLDQYEAAIDSFAATGCKVAITEWDMSALPTLRFGAEISDTIAYQKELNPYPDGLPAKLARRWNKRMGSVMDIYLRHADVIDRVTAWGVTDADSWKNNWPVPGRTEYPLLLDRQHKLKPFLKKYSEKK